MNCPPKLADVVAALNRLASSRPHRLQADFCLDAGRLGPLVASERVLSIGCGVGSDSATGRNARHGIALASVGRG